MLFGALLPAPLPAQSLAQRVLAADSAVVWPELLRLARDTTVREETRRQAVFWLGQAASEEAARGLDSIAADGGGDIEIRKHAVFALS